MSTSLREEIWRRAHGSTEVLYALFLQLFLQSLHAHHVHLLVFRQLQHRRYVHRRRERRTEDLFLCLPRARHARLSLNFVVQILAKAAEGGLGATAVRMGQACGSKATGAWGTTEWMPSMVKSSVALGCLPAMSGVSDFLSAPLETC